MSATVVVDLDALAGNIMRVKTLCTGRRILAVVKADAYGHGAPEVARALAPDKDLFFGVARVSEALPLRQIIRRAPILVLYEPLVVELKEALQHGLAITVSSPERVPDLVKAAERLQRIARLHLRVDVGFGPPGIPHASALSVADSVRRQRALRLDGLFTHLSDPSDYTCSQQQLSVFTALLSDLDAAGIEVPLVHAASSGAVLRYPGSFFDMIRVGTLLYGQPRGPRGPLLDGFEGVMKWSTAIREVRDIEAGSTLGYAGSYTAPRRLRVGVIAAGYGDGLRKSPDDRRDVLVRGRRVPILGRPMMDACFIDVTETGEAAVGDEVVLLGRQEDKEILASEVAGSLGVPTPEVWCSVRSRVPRIYVLGGRRITS